MFVTIFFRISIKNQFSGIFAPVGAQVPPFQVLCHAEKSDSKSCRTFLYPLYTLDIASSNAAVSYYGLPSPVVPAAAGNPWTSPRPRKHATGIFSTLVTLGPGFQVQRRISKKSVDKNRQTFLAGALGLEPRAYGFGDRRSTN